MPTVPHRIASAFAVLCGRSGDVTTRANDRERSRPSLDREAQLVANAGDGAAARAPSDARQRRLAAERAAAHALPGRRKHAVEITPAKEDEFATVAPAAGVSLSGARRRLRAVAGSQSPPSAATGSQSPPSAATRGRPTLEAGPRAGPGLEVLDEAARPAGNQGTADAIGGDPDPP